MPSKQPKRRSKARSRRVAKPARAVARKRVRGSAVENYDRSLREHLLYLLSGGGAHVSVEEAMGDFPAELRGVRPVGLPFTAWRLLEHMRIAQWDILEFSRSAKHVSPEFPKGYWPEADAPPD